MADREPHEVLGVARDASDDEVRAAYREMVKKHHPDVSDDDDAEERFVRIRNAYETMQESEPKPTGSEQTPDGNRDEEDTRRWKRQRDERRRRQRQRRKAWEDEWENFEGEDGKGKGRESTEEEAGGTDRNDTADGERVESLGYGWSLFVASGGGFYVSKRGGRGRVYLGDDGRAARDRTLFGSRDGAEKAYERHVERRETDERRSSLGDGWDLVRNAGRYAVEGEDGYVGFDGRLQDRPYWFSSRDAAERMHEEYVHDEREDGSGVASRVAVGAALLPFYVTVSLLNVVGASLGIGSGGRHPYISTGLVTLFLGSLAVFFESFILLFFAVWTGIEFFVMVMGPYTADEIRA